MHLTFIQYTFIYIYISDYIKPMHVSYIDIWWHHIYRVHKAHETLFQLCLTLVC